MNKMSVLFFLILLSDTVAQNQLQAQPKNSRPDIIIFLLDDLGWKDLSCYGSSFYETPNLDRLAAAGARFTNGYAASPVCSPTRASMLTGKYPARNAVTDWIPGRQGNGKARSYEKYITPPTANQLALDQLTIGEIAGANGYRTFYAGKWHLGEEEKYWPQHQGFQVNLGGTGKGSPSGKKNDSTGGFFTPYQLPNLPDGPPGEYLTDRLTDECLKFIRQQQDTPYLMIHSLYAVHNPMQAPRQLIEKYRRKKEGLEANQGKFFDEKEPWMKNESGWKTRLVQDHPVYAAMMENMDWNLGRMIRLLEETGKLANTIIIFTSDNGGLSTAEGSPTSNLPLRAGKGWLFEGGIRVPMLMYWKGKIAAGTVADIPVHTVDIFPTLSRVIQPNHRSVPPTDGKDLLELISHPDKSRNRILYWYYPHYSNQGGKPGAAIRQGDYKLIYDYEQDQYALYNLALDIGEQKDIAAINLSRFRYLKRKLQAWLEKNGTLSMNLNPGFQQ